MQRRTLGLDPDLDLHGLHLIAFGSARIQTAEFGTEESRHVCNPHAPFLWQMRNYPAECLQRGGRGKEAEGAKLLAAALAIESCRQQIEDAKM